MGGGSSAPKRMEEIRVLSNESLVKNPEKFENKNDYKYLPIFIYIILTIFIFILLFLLYFYYHIFLLFYKKKI